MISQKSKNHCVEIEQSPLGEKFGVFILFYFKVRFFIIANIAKRVSFLIALYINKIKEFIKLSLLFDFVMIKAKINVPHF